MSDAYDAGAAAGRDIGRSAIDCPYPPTDTSGLREAWLAGFGSTRGEASPGSDPEHTAGQREPTARPTGGRPNLHEG